MSLQDDLHKPNQRHQLLDSALIRWLELFVVALAAPALWFPTVRVQLTLLAILLLLLTWLTVALVEGVLWPRSSLDGPLLVIILMAALGAWTSPAPQLTLPKVTGLLLGLAAYRAILRCVRGPIPSRSAGLQTRSSLLHSDRAAASLHLIIYGLLLLACAFSLIGLVGGIRATKLAAVSFAWARIPRFLGALPGTQDGLISTNQLGGTLLFILPVSRILSVKRSARLWTGLGGPTGQS